MRISTLIQSVTLSGLLISSLSYAHAQPKKCEDRLPPKTLSGYTLNYQILRSQTELADVPYKGVIVSQYQNRQFRSQGTGTLNNNSDPALEYSDGRYSYEVEDCDKAVEKAILQTPQFSRRTTRLSFTSRQAGIWEQDYDNGKVVLSGKFSLVKSEAPDTAPETNAGLHHALIIKSTLSELPPDSYPRAGLVVQTYQADGTMTFVGTGPGTIDSTGTYSFKRVSPNTAVEEAVQTSAFFTLPYTMVYTFETASSGTWEQNFANGLIQFSGTFDSFPAQ